MGLDINTISDATLRKVATKYAQDNDLSKQEFQKMISTEKGLAERLSEGGVSELKKMEFDLDDSGAWTKFNREDWSAQMQEKLEWIQLQTGLTAVTINVLTVKTTEKFL